MRRLLVESTYSNWPPLVLLIGSDDTFSWADPGGAVTAWWLYAGSTQGGNDYEDGGNLGGAMSYSTVSGNLPGLNVPVYVWLWYQEGVGAA